MTVSATGGYRNYVLGVFGNPMCRNCTKEKVRWMGFAENLMERNTDIDTKLNRNWDSIVEREREGKEK
jgi:hypothetical protein